MTARDDSGPKRRVRDVGDEEVEPAPWCVVDGRAGRVRRQGSRGPGSPGHRHGSSQPVGVRASDWPASTRSRPRVWSSCTRPRASSTSRMARIGMFMAYVYWELRINHGVPTLIAVPLVVLDRRAPLLGVALDRCDHAPPAGSSARRAADGHRRPDARFHRPRGNDLGPATQSHALPHALRERRFPTSATSPLTWHAVHDDRGRGRARDRRCASSLFRTRLGVAMRAVVDNRDLAALGGCASPTSSRASRGRSGCSLAAIAGILIAPEPRHGRWPAHRCSSSTRSLPRSLVASEPSADLCAAPLLAPSIQFSQQFLTLSGRWTRCRSRCPTIMLFIVLLLLPQAQAAVRPHRRGPAHRTGVDACATPRSAWSCSSS